MLRDIELPLADVFDREVEHHGQALAKWLPDNPWRVEVRVLSNQIHPRCAVIVEAHDCRATGVRLPVQELLSARARR